MRDDENYNVVTEEESVSKKEKLINRLKSYPKDLTFEEVRNLLQYFGYVEYQKGHTSGSRIIFKCDKHAPILLHKPHPRKTLLEYQVKQLIEILEQEGLI
jgi:hypothetical protein